MRFRKYMVGVGCLGLFSFPSFASGTPPDFRLQVGLQIKVIRGLAFTTTYIFCGPHQGINFALSQISEGKPNFNELVEKARHLRATFQRAYENAAEQANTLTGQLASPEPKFRLRMLEEHELLNEPPSIQTRAILEYRFNENDAWEYLSDYGDYSGSFSQEAFEFDKKMLYQFAAGSGPQVVNPPPDAPKTIPANDLSGNVEDNPEKINLDFYFMKPEN